MKPTIKECRHGTFMYLENDEYVGRSLHHYGEYSENEWKLMAQVLKEGMLVIDGGANMGAVRRGEGDGVGGRGSARGSPEVEGRGAGAERQAAMTVMSGQAE